MKSFSFAKVLTLGSLICLALPVACGDDDDNGTTKPTTSGGEAGESSGGSGATTQAGGAGGMPAMMLPEGLSDKASVMMCKEEPKCTSAAVAGGTVNVNPCCTADGACGLDPGFFKLVGHPFASSCEAKAQPGTLDKECKSATGLVVNFGEIKVPLDDLPGCCRDDGKCGVSLDVANSGGKPISQLGLGCIDAAPFFNGVTQACGAGGAGGAGGGGAGGAPSTGGAGGAG